MNMYKLSLTLRYPPPRPDKPYSFVMYQDGDTPRQAMDSLRSSLYKVGFDNILFKKVEIAGRGFWAEIPMYEALGLA